MAPVGTMLLVGLSWLGSPLANETDEIDFGADVLPILSDNCFACHGPDEAQRQADLRLDREPTAKEDRGGYFVIDTDQPLDSELLARILSDDDSLAMPPVEHRKRLTDEQKDTLIRWIEQGAPWSGHWAYERPRRSSSPRHAWPQHSASFVDDYINVELERQAIEPQSRADAVTLARRVSFDLTGLPPTPEQVARFVNDPSPDAYERMVDRLLASPAFGERMAVYWLDLVRYADSVGYHGDQSVSVSPYRDYVIQAFNSNTPFDTFTRQQIAGDLLESRSELDLIASGYNRLGMMSAEGGVQPEEYLAKYAADRVRTTASVWLGLTLGCAECHDHKFDPLLTSDFYRFAAYFADIQEKGLYAGAHESGDWGPSIRITDVGLERKLDAIDAQIETHLEQLNDEDESLATEFQTWLDGVLENTTSWHALEPKSFQTYHQTSAEIQQDQSVLLTGTREDEDAYAIVAANPVGSITGLRLEALPDESLPANGPGRAGNGNFVVTEIAIVRGDHRDRMEDLKKVVNAWPDDLKNLQLNSAEALATFEQVLASQNNPHGKWSAESAIDSDEQGTIWGWAVLPSVGEPSELVVRFEEPIEFERDESLTVVIHQYHGNGGHLLGRFRLSVTSDDRPKLDPRRELPSELRDIIAIDQSSWTVEQHDQLFAHFIQIAPRFASLREVIEALRATRRETISSHTRTTLVTATVEPRETRVLPRGDWMDRSGEVVQPGIPVLFESAHPDHPSIDQSLNESSERQSREDLADWLISNENPLTSRVFVNRIWMLLFGHGLSRAVDDVGAQGQKPSHPELLDRLAIEFVESDWDVKFLIRTIVLSETYQRTSIPNEESLRQDPTNTWLARQNRFRLDAEFIRDQSLLVGGIINRQVGGRSVFPYQPVGLYQHLNFPRRTYQADDGAQQYRRGVYTHWQRQFLHPALKSFDAPAREECSCQRARSSTPLSALVMLNDPTSLECARNLAVRALAEIADSESERLSWLFQQCVTRAPIEAELDVLRVLLVSQKNYYLAHQAEAQELVSIGDSPTWGELNSPPTTTEILAAWMAVARATMNMHEFIMRN